MVDYKLHTAFIINPKSGTPKFVSRVHYLIRKHLGKDNRGVSVYKSRYPGHVYEIAARVADEGYDMCVAVGGDGTMNETARGLINSDTALGVIPTGSGNGYARNIGLPLRVEPALSIIENPSFRQIDVGRINEHIFLVSCGIGWEAVIATLFEGSRIRGILPYYQLTVSTFLQYEPQEIKIESNPGNWQYNGRPLLFSVANMKEYGVGVSIAPEAKDDDGFLDICLIPGIACSTRLNTARICSAEKPPIYRVISANSLPKPGLYAVMKAIFTSMVRPNQPDES